MIFILMYYISKNTIVIVIIVYYGDVCTQLQDCAWWLWGKQGGRERGRGRGGGLKIISNSTLQSGKIISMK